MKKIYTNMSGLTFEVIEKLENRKVVVMFHDTGSIIYTDGRNLSAGKVKDPMFKSYLNVGYLGNHDNKCKHHKKSLITWHNMLKRCYDKDYGKSYYGKVFVSNEWKCYANFQRDIKLLDGFSEWATKGSKLNLDKDLLGGGALYSKETCCFLDEKINKSLGKKGKKLINGQWLATTV